MFLKISLIPIRVHWWAVVQGNGTTCAFNGTVFKMPNSVQNRASCVFHSVSSPSPSPSSPSFVRLKCSHGVKHTLFLIDIDD